MKVTVAGMAYLGLLIVSFQSAAAVCQLAKRMLGLALALYGFASASSRLPQPSVTRAQLASVQLYTTTLTRSVRHSALSLLSDTQVALASVGSALGLAGDKLKTPG